MNTYLADQEDSSQMIGNACDGDERLKNSYGGFFITWADELVIHNSGKCVVFTEGRVPPTPYDFRSILWVI